MHESCHVRRMWSWKRPATAIWSALLSKPYILSDSLLAFLATRWSETLELRWTLKEKIMGTYYVCSSIFNYFHLSSILDIDAVFSEWQDSLRYVVQVAAVTAAGRGPWSEQPLSRIAASIFLGLTSGYDQYQLCTWWVFVNHWKLKSISSAYFDIFDLFFVLWCNWMTLEMVVEDVKGMLEVVL